MRTELESGERQVKPTLEEIRQDHVERYTWADARIDATESVIDAGCGVGYGTALLHACGRMVAGLDRSEEALAYAKEHYPGPVYLPVELESPSEGHQVDVVVAFEILEHLERPEGALWAFRMWSDRLLLSVPNETEFPWSAACKFHERHYTHADIAQLLWLNGWEVASWYGQIHEEAPVVEGMFGRTIVLEARRREGVDPEPTPLPPELIDPRVQALALPGKPLPKRVAIVAQGGSHQSYAASVQHAGARSRLFDEVWTLNANVDVDLCDRAFFMDDWHVQRLRAEAAPESQMGGIMSWAEEYEGFAYTSRKYDYMGDNWHEYPLDLVVERWEMDYLNNSVPMMLALALTMGVKYIYLYGTDYDYAGHAYKSEKGRACLEFWLGIAHTQDVRVICAAGSSLYDARERVATGRSFYGYWTEDVQAVRLNDGRWTVTRAELPPERIPTAEEIEAVMTHDARMRP